MLRAPSAPRIGHDRNSAFGGQIAAALIPPRIILASTSKYRAELLARLGVPFEQEAPGVDETAQPGEAPADLARRLARRKAEKVARENCNSIVIGSDQVLAVGQRALGKPGSHLRAVEQLRDLSGKEVRFYTAVCLIDSNTMQAVDASSEVAVQFRFLSEATIERYLQLDQPYDCAGSAKAEALGIALIERIDSTDPTALIGLPLISVVSLLEQLGWPLFDLIPNA